MRGWGRPLGLAGFWLAQWAGYVALAGSGMSRPAAFAACAGVALFAMGRSMSAARKALLAGGFPASFAALMIAHGAGLPGWAWLAPLIAGALIFPRLSQEDAPLWFSPKGALDELAREVELPAGARVMDAGSGAGHGLRALRRAYPQARVSGVEASRALCALSRAWEPQARVARADLWSSPWTDQDLVYLFLRPEAMARALDKALGEMRDDAWVASLEFALPAPSDWSGRSKGKTLYAYRVGSLRERMRVDEAPMGAQAAKSPPAAEGLEGRRAVGESSPGRA